MVMTQERLLSISEAARRLGVSESTLRKWADSGIIKVARLPGSGYRRFRPEEVERVRRDMGLNNSEG